MIARQGKGLAAKAMRNQGIICFNIINIERGEKLAEKFTLAA